MQDAKEEVRSRLAIEDVIGEYVQLKRAGRNFKGLSPFTNEKTPSFMVSPEKQIWHDFSANRGGDIFTFIMDAEGLDFRESLELLARKAGVDLSLYSGSGKEDGDKKKRLLAINDLACRYYQQTLLKNHHALDYVFSKRRLDKSVVSEFRIGYAPTSGDALVNFLIRKGFKREDIAAAGLSNRFGSDLFRGRMMLPLTDVSGQVIGFTGRIIVDDPKAPKYLNTPQTLLYDKGRHVFGLAQARQAIRGAGYAVIVEGNLDVVSSHQAGVRTAVATAGTAMTEQHLRTIKRLAGIIKLAYDSDAAGLAATERAIPIASSVGVDLTVISLPTGYKDPDELIRSDAASWEAAIANDEPAVEWVLKRYAQRYDLASASGKRAFTSAALAVIGGLSDPVEREHYEKMTAEIASTTLESLRTKSQAAKSQRALKRVKTRRDPVAPSYDHIDTVLGLAFTDLPVRSLLSDLPNEAQSDERRHAVCRYLVDHPDKVFNDTPRGLKNYDEYVKIILVRAENRYEGWDEDDRLREAADILRKVKTEHDRNQLEQALKEAVASGDEQAIGRLRTEYYEFIKEVKRGQR